MYTWKVLGYLGLLPFIAGPILVYAPTTLPFDIETAFIAYSAIIASFISGSLWRVNKHEFKQQQLISNIICLIAFSSLLIEHHMALLMLIACYVWLLLYQTYLHRQQAPINQDIEYMTMRFRLSAIVVICHIIILIQR